jgi:hypothetical protein
VPVPGSPTAVTPVVDAPGAAPTPDAPAATPYGASPPVPEPQVAPQSVAEGWYQDPWGAAAYRYWDGAQWTGHISGPSTVEVAGPRLDEERAAGRWAKVGLAWGGPALAVSTIAGAYQWRWIADHWDEITTPGSDVQQTGNNGAAIAGQLAGIILLVVGVLFLLWFHRAASNAASAGVHARRSPVLGTLSFIIPVLNLWWPYQSACDMLPADHPGRVAVRRWWALWIGCTIAGFATIAAAATLNDAAIAITAAVGAVLALLAAVAARTVVDAISDAHGQLLAHPA